MRKQLEEWCEIRAYVKVTIIDKKSNNASLTSYVGFLLDFDNIGLSITLSHTKKKLVLIPWSSIESIQLWGES